MLTNVINLDIVIITDKSPALINAIETEFPSIYRRDCALHGLNNLHKGERKFNGEEKKLYWDCVTSSSIREYNAAANILAELRPSLDAQLSDIDKAKWSSVCSPNDCWNPKTNNLAEQQNSALGTEVRKMPPVALIKNILHKLQRKFYERYQACKLWGESSSVSNYAIGKYKTEKEYARLYTVQQIDVNAYQVQRAPQPYTENWSSFNIVELCKYTKKYVCKEHKREEDLPCSHMLAVATHKKVINKLFDDNNVKLWFNRCYLTKTILEAYSVRIDSCIDRNLHKEQMHGGKYNNYSSTF